MQCTLRTAAARDAMLAAHPMPQFWHDDSNAAERAKLEAVAIEAFKAGVKAAKEVQMHPFIRPPFEDPRYGALMGGWTAFQRAVTDPVHTVSAGISTVALFGLTLPKSSLCLSLFVSLSILFRFSFHLSCLALAVELKWPG